MILAASMLVTSLSAQAFTVKGVVIDRSTKEPLIGATVQVSGTTVGAITDMDGRFELNRIEGGSCTLVVQYVSYRTSRPLGPQTSGPLAEQQPYSRPYARNWQSSKQE